MAQPSTWNKKLVALRDATAVLMRRTGKQGETIGPATTAWKKFRHFRGLKPE